MGHVSSEQIERRIRLERLRDRYQALNLRSRSVRLYRTTSSGALDLYVLRALRPRAFDVFAAHLGTEYHSPIPVIEILPEDPEQRRFADALGTIARTARETRMAIGAHDLAVGWPFVEGRGFDGTWVRGPLFLYPVTLATTTLGRVRWTVTFEGLPDCNETLLHVLGASMGRRLGLADFLEADEDGLFKIDEETWRSFSGLLRRHGLPLENPDDGLPGLEPVEPRNKEAREAAPRGRFALKNHLVLGRFPKWGSTVVQDYEALLEQDLSDSALGVAARLLAVDEHAEWEGGHGEGGTWESGSFWDPGEEERSDGFLGGGGDTGGLDGSGAAGDEGGLDSRTQFRRWQVLASDPAQDAVFAFLDRKDGTGLVVQGPPGTGKSQLITNLVSAAIGSGKTVLVACQKRAALDVVADRLAVHGLAEPLAVVHDVERDRNSVCEDIARTVARLFGADVRPEALEASLAAGRTRHEQALHRLHARLNLAREAYHALAVSADGLPPLAELQERAFDDDGRPLPDLGEFAREVTESRLEEVLPRVEALCVESQKVASPHPLAVRARWHDVGEEALDTIFDLLDQAAELAASLQELPEGMTPAEALEHAELWDQAAPLLDLVAGDDQEDQNRFRFFWVWTEGDLEHGEWQRVMDLLSTARHQLTAVPADMVRAPRDQMEAQADGLGRLQQLEALWYRAFLPEWWRLRKLPSSVVRAYGLDSSSDEDPVRLESLCREALRWMDLICDLPLDMPFMQIGLQGDPDDLADLEARLRRWHALVQAVHLLSRSLAPRGGAYAEWPDMTEVDRPLNRTPLLEAAIADRTRADLFRRFGRVLESLRPYFQAEMIAQLEQQAGEGRLGAVTSRLERLRQARGQAREVARVDRLMAELPDWAWAFLTRWRSRRPGSREGVSADLRTALERAWRTIRLAGRHPHVLEAPLVDPEQLQQLEGELDAMREVAAEGVHARYFRRLVRLTEHAGRRRVLRKLEAEVRKRRRRLSLRQLVERYWDTGLKQVRPAWFCSPESIAALFPLQPGLFDLVIFDEASQCPVESALPALVRARRVVIAGDEQQMPPTHFFRAALNEDMDEDDDQAILASGSILSLARIALDTTTLRWHYRSRHEELVAFSNAAFYDGRLVTAPCAGGKVRPYEGLHWERVEGYWKDQVNEVEAHRVVALIGRLLQVEEGETPPSVGVVTFNRKQAALIERLIDLRSDQDAGFQAALARDRTRPVVEQLFVRNLENVQGDERDVIVFSTAYGPSGPGKRVLARFGPLGQEGGEKRLNVAITRARRGVWVVASFDPDTLDVSSAKHPGPRLFQLYLRFVQRMARTGRVPTDLFDAARTLGRARPTPLDGGSWERPGTIGRKVLQQLTRTLQQQGYRTRTEVGLGGLKLDLAVGHRDSQAWCLGIDCRGFLSVPDDLARDVYFPGFWRRMGWQVRRVSPAMWLDRRDRVLQEIAAACNKADPDCSAESSLTPKNP